MFVPRLPSTAMEDLICIPARVQEILDTIGQVGAEVPCSVDECRKFLAISKASAYSIHNFLERFPYFAEREWIYHVYRYRVRSDLVETDANVSPEELWDYQKIYIADSVILEQLLSMWLDDLDLLGRPVDCNLPV